VIIFITVCMTLVFLAGGCGPKTKAVTTEMKKGDEKSREIFFSLPCPIPRGSST
jgi:hypothetical protein